MNQKSINQILRKTTERYGYLAPILPAAFEELKFNKKEFERWSSVADLFYKSQVIRLSIDDLLPSKLEVLITLKQNSTRISGVSH